MDDPSPISADIVPSKPTQDRILQIGRYTIVFTRRTRVIVSLVGLAGLATIGLSFPSEFDQTRNVVSLWYSRVWLIGLCFIIFLAVWLVSGQMIKQRWAVAVSLILAVCAFVVIDTITPKPSENSSPRNA